MYKSDTKVLNNTASFSGGQPIYFPGAGELIGNLNWFKQEITHLCNGPWAPFTSGYRFSLNSWLLESNLPKSRINEYVGSGGADSESFSYDSRYTCAMHAGELDAYCRYLESFEGQVVDRK